MENVLAGRTSNGRFALGNKGGPGNPYAQQTAAVRALLPEMLTENDLRDVVRALIKRAKEGHFPAIKLILERFMGKGQGAWCGGPDEGVALAAVGLPVQNAPSTGSPTAASGTQAANLKPAVKTVAEILREGYPQKPLVDRLSSAAGMLAPVTHLNPGALNITQKAETRRLSR